MNRYRTIVIAIVITIATATSLHAQLSDSQREQLVSDMRASADQLDASKLPDLELSQQEFLHRVADVQQHLDRATSPQNRDAWLEYFKFDPLVEAIDSGASPATTTQEAVSLKQRLIGTYEGLEVEQVRAVREAVNQLIPAIRYRDRDKAVAVIAKQLNALATRFEGLQSVPSIDDAAASNLILGILDDANQDVPAVETLRSLYSRCNVRLWVGEPFVQQLIGRNIDEYQPVTDCILGTRITGTAHFVGHANVDILPATGAVRMKVTVSGQANSNNVGYNGPVRLRTQGFAGLCVSRTVNASEAGVTFEPTYVDLNLRTKINAIEHRSRLVRKIAWRKARQTKDMADRIAVQRMRERLRSQFDKDTQDRASIAPDPLARVRPVLQRLEFPEPSREVSSTDDAIVLHSMLRRSDQVGSAVSPPPFPANHNAVLQLHESALDNALGHLLAGRTINEKQINQLLSEAGRPLPAAEDNDETPFEIDFATVRPIVFEARENALRVGIRGTRFAQGRRELERSMSITAVYTPATAQDGRVILVREGDVRVDFPGGRRLTLGQAGLRRTIRDQFADVFPAILLDRPLKVPSDFRLEALRGREFRPEAIMANDGWLTVGVR